MTQLPPTCIIRHRRENLKKCSLQPLEGKDGFSFFTYPDCLGKLPDLTSYVLLDLDGPPLSPEDRDLGLIVIDATWRLAGKMVAQIKELQSVPKRSIPPGFQTAYPRRQEDCKNKDAGLASIEALYIAFRLQGKEADFLLNNYYWKNEFLTKNKLKFIDNNKKNIV